MAVSPYKTFIAGEVLTASDLNASFSQIFDNAASLAWPATTSRDFDGNALILDADQDTSITADTDDQIDFRVGGSDRFVMQIDSTVPDFRAQWDDAGAATGPYITFYRNSSSPAAEDLIGRLRWLGEDSAGNEQFYAAIDAIISDPTSTTEDGRLLFSIPVGGTEREVVRIGGGYLLRVQDFSTDAAAGPTVRLLRNSTSSAADDDLLGVIQYAGLDDADNTETYGEIGVQIEDASNDAEESRLIFRVQNLSVLTDVLSVGVEAPAGLPAARLYANNSGATVGPILYLQRDSANPADSDVLAGLYFQGDDEDGPTEQTYAKAEAVISDATNASLAGGVQISAATGGSLALALDIGPGGVAVGEPTGGVPSTAGHLNAVALYEANVRVHPITFVSTQATTSGSTPISWTGLPATIRRITILFNAVSTDGTEEITIQLGDSGGFHNSGYVGSVFTDNFAGSGFEIDQGGAAGDVYYGKVELVPTDANGTTWIASGVISETVTNTVSYTIAGAVTLDTVLTQVQVTTTGTPDDWDGGAITLIYEA